MAVDLENKSTGMKEMVISDTQYPYFPDIEVDLDGTYGNAAEIMFKVTKELEKNDVPSSEIRKFIKESTRKDYINLMQVCMRWVNIV